MKLYVRIVGVALLAVAMVVLAGCGEKDKFAKAQTEVMQLAKQADALDITSAMKNARDKDGAKQDLEAVANVKKQHQQIMDQIQTKFNEMEGYAKSEPTLGPTLENLKTEIEQQDKSWNQGMNETEYITGLALKEYKAPDPDPWTAHSKW